MSEVVLSGFNAGRMVRHGRPGGHAEAGGDGDPQRNTRRAQCAGSQRALVQFGRGSAPQQPAGTRRPHRIRNAEVGQGRQSLRRPRRLTIKMAG